MKNILLVILIIVTNFSFSQADLETTAFVVLSLLRQNQYAAEIAEGIQFLTSNRENGRCTHMKQS